jgi:hypothetical protein
VTLAVSLSSEVATAMRLLLLSHPSTPQAVTPAVSRSPEGATATRLLLLLLLSRRAAVTLAIATHSLSNFK